MKRRTEYLLLRAIVGWNLNPFKVWKRFKRGCAK